MSAKHGVVGIAMVMVIAASAEGCGPSEEDVKACADYCNLVFTCAGRPSCSLMDEPAARATCKSGCETSGLEVTDAPCIQCFVSQAHWACDNPGLLWAGELDRDSRLSNCRDACPGAELSQFASVMGDALCAAAP